MCGDAKRLSGCVALTHTCWLIISVLAQQKRSVLKDCNIVFSGVFPISGQRGPESHYLWRLAVDLGARPSMVMNDFPITHLVIHPGRLGTQKHVQVCLCKEWFAVRYRWTHSAILVAQAKGTPNVFVVTPEWIFKSARSWERASEKDFLADEWKAKQERLAAAQEAAKVASTVEAAPAAQEAQAAAAEQPETAPVSASEQVEPPRENTEKDDVTAEKGGVSVDQPDASAETVEAKLKKKKNVSFAASVEGGEEESGETKEGEKTDGKGSLARLGSSSLRQRRAPVRRVIGGARVGGGRIPENKGVVASGGTFDFLSKITQIGAAKRELKPVEAPKPVTAAKAVVPEPAAAKVRLPTSVLADMWQHLTVALWFDLSPQDVDDAFLRLIEAEERENEVESKRKLESDDVKDMLSSRRLKKAKTSAAPGPVGAAASAALAPVSSEDDDDDGDVRSWIWCCCTVQVASLS